MSNLFKKLAFIPMLVLISIFSQAQDGHGIRIAAHRGFWKCEEAQEAQNSIASLRLAQENGFWGSETDIHLTSDDVILVNHDNDINGVAIHTNPYSEFSGMSLANGEKPPVLDEYLEQVKKCRTTELVLEFKTLGSEERECLLVDMSIEKLKNHGLYEPDRVIFISFSLAACGHIARIAPEFTNQYLNGDLAPDELHEKGINGLDYNLKVLYEHPEWVTRAHELGMSVNVWTVDKEEDIRNFIDLGVDCITTNEPLLVRELLGDRECRITVDEGSQNKAAAKTGKARRAARKAERQSDKTR